MLFIDSSALLQLHVTQCKTHTDYDFAELGLVLQDLNRLQALTLDACDLRERTIHKLFTVFVCTTSLTSLSLADNMRLGEGGVIALCAALRVNASLTSLNLRGCNLGIGDAEELAQLLMVSPSLTDLQVCAVLAYSHVLSVSISIT